METMYDELNEEEEIFLLEVPREKDGMRLDRFLAEQFPEHTRSFLQKLIREGHVTLSEKPVTKAGVKLTAGDWLAVTFSPPEELSILPENIPLDILYEDNDLLVVNKPKDMVVHPAPGHTVGTLVNAIMYHCGDSLSGINGVIRPGIVHRIDRDTTGSLIVCKNDQAHNAIAAQIKEHSVNRIYRGIVIGNLKEEEGTVESTIGRSPTDRKKMAMNVKNGKDAVTHYKVLQRFPGYTYAQFQLETGRTHQIRVHMAGIGHPLLGDTVYGPSKCKFDLQGQTLHAMTIGFVHPTTGQYMELDAPLPEYFEDLLRKLG